MMGYILHAATITSYPSLMDAEIGEPWKTQRAEADAKLAQFRESLPEDWRRLIVGPVESLTNEGDDYRARFIELFGADFTVRWGDEEPRLTETYVPAKEA